MAARTAPYPPGTPCWVDLGTPDLEAATAFYTQLFGWAAQPAGPVEQTGGYGFFTKDGRRVAGYGPLHGQGHPPVWATYLATDDIEATVAAAREAGGNIVTGPVTVGPAGRMAFVQDPAKAVVGLWQAGTNFGAELVNEPGAWTWNELSTRDVEASTAFLQALFPALEPHTQDVGAVRYTTWQLDGAMVAGMLPMPEGVPDRMPSHWAVYFAVEDCDAALARAVELGGTEALAPTDIPMGRFAFVADPHGATFAVMAFSGAAAGA
jgi:predicted enzyme related to lactoylglutathione lyase